MYACIHVCASNVNECAFFGYFLLTDRQSRATIFAGSRRATKKSANYGANKKPTECSNRRLDRSTHRLWARQTNRASVITTVRQPVSQPAEPTVIAEQLIAMRTQHYKLESEWLTDTHTRQQAYRCHNILVHIYTHTHKHRAFQQASNLFNCHRKNLESKKIYAANYRNHQTLTILIYHAHIHTHNHSHTAMLAKAYKVTTKKQKTTSYKLAIIWYPFW